MSGSDSGELNCFVSYTHADRAWAEWIAWQLRQAGHTVFVRAWDIRPGSDWVHEMHAALARAECALLVLSERYLSSSEFGEAEWRALFAQDPSGKARRMIPVRVEECRPEGLLATREYVDLVELSERDATAALLDGLREHGVPTRAPGFPGHRAPAVSDEPRFPGELPPPPGVREPLAPQRELPGAEPARVVERPDTEKPARGDGGRVPRDPARLPKRLLAVAASIAALLVVVAAVHPWRREYVVDTGWLTGPARPGSVTYCTDADRYGALDASVRDFNARYGPDKLTARRQGGFDIANYQLSDIEDKIAQGSCDVVYLDVAYTPYFAAKDLLFEMSPYLNSRAGEFDRSILQTVKYNHKSWGAPKHLNAGLLFYRGDLVRTPPASWQDVCEKANDLESHTPFPPVRLQLRDYEGRVVNFLELAYSAGARDIFWTDNGGWHADLDQTATVRALTFMVDQLGSCFPTSAQEQKEKGSAWAWRADRAWLIREWVPTARELYKSAGLRNKRWELAVDSLPPLARGEPKGTGILGGADLVIPRSAPNPRGALRFVDFVTQLDQVRRDAMDYTLAPVLNKLWSDPEVGRSRNPNHPFGYINRNGLKVRPPLASWPCISQDISAALQEAFQGSKTPKQALESKEENIGKLLDERSCNVM